VPWYPSKSGLIHTRIVKRIESHRYLFSLKFCCLCDPPVFQPKLKKPPNICTIAPINGISGVINGISGVPMRGLPEWPATLVPLA
jgi:hypothetical protein